MLTGVNIYAGTGVFADFGKPLATVTVTYVDGDTSIARLSVGTHVRDYFNSGPLTCAGTNHPLHTARPSDPKTSYVYEVGGRYLDAQELPLPKIKRSKRVASVRFDGVLLSRICGPPFPVNIYAGSRLAAFSLWPRFKIVNGSADTVVRQSQTTGHRHGGYLAGNEVVGWRRFTDATGCKITALAMAYTFAGFNCSVDSLNAFLQRKNGYNPSQVCVLSGVAPDGSSVTFTPHTGDDTRLRDGDTFLVERGVRSNPLATYQVTSAGHATRIGQHNTSVIPVVNDVGRVYWNSIPTIADTYTHPRLRSVPIPEGPNTAALVESLLVHDIAVQLNVGPYGGHWVVADGMTSSFRPDGGARGTYSIKDPFDERNFTKLIEGQYQNVFTQARYVEPAGLPLGSPALAASGQSAGLSLLADGARRIEIVDPLGRRMMRDAATGEGTYEIPGATIEDVHSEHDNGGSADGLPTAYEIDVPTAVDGRYIVNVYNDVGLSLSASGYDASGVFATDIVAVTTAGPVGSTYEVMYSSSAGSLTIGYSGVLGVEPVPQAAHSSLHVRRSPASGPVEFRVTGLARGRDVVEIFDVRGRRVGAVECSYGVGTESVTWDWRAEGCSPGVYLARLRSGTTAVVRFVVIR